jgi:hypothetical protein
VLNILPILLLCSSLFATFSQQVEHREVTIAQDTCARSTPTPIVKKSVFPNTSFVLKKTNNRGLVISEGIETVKLNNGDRLTITNSGCEFLTLNFRFETNRRPQHPKHSQYLYQRSARLMRQIVGGLNSPIDLQSGIIALENYGAKNARPELDTIIKYKSSIDFRSVVQLLDRPQPANGKERIEVLFYYGPL